MRAKLSFPATLLLILVEKTVADAHHGSWQISRAINVSDACREADPATEFEIFTEFFRIYTNWHRPIMDAMQPVHVNVSVFLTSLRDIKENDGTISVTGFFDLQWYDHLHKWHTHFPLNCVPYLVLPSKLIWIPELALISSPEGWSPSNRDSNGKVILWNDGFASYNPGGEFVSFCSFDVTFFPFDSHVCTLQFESWRYSTDYFRLKLVNDIEEESPHWNEASNWKLVSIVTLLTRHRDADRIDLDFDSLEISVKIARKPVKYIFQLVLPSLLMALLPLASLICGANNRESWKMSLVGLIGFALHMMTHQESIPISSKGFPVLLILQHFQLLYLTLITIAQSVEHDVAENSRMQCSLFNSHFARFFLRIYSTLGFKLSQVCTIRSSCHRRRPSNTVSSSGSQPHAVCLSSTPYEPEQCICDLLMDIDNSDEFSVVGARTQPIIVTNTLAERVDSEVVMSTKGVQVSSCSDISSRATLASSSKKAATTITSSNKKALTLSKLRNPDFISRFFVFIYVFLTALTPLFVILIAFIASQIIS